MRELFLLDDDVVFLNHGSFGACPKLVFQAYQNWQLKLERQPVAFLDQARDFIKYMEPVRIALAEELGASPDDLVGLTNATEGLNIVAQSLKLEPGDEILTSDHEYGALEKTWELVSDRTGAKVVEVEIPLPLVSEEKFSEVIINAMTDRTKVLFLSHGTSPTALVFPIKKVVDEARTRGIITVIDGAHIPSLIELNLNELDADFYSGNCHKWMMAPKGAAFLWARRDAQPMLEPLVVSHGWIPQSGGPEQIGPFGNSRFIDCFEVRGTRDPAAWLAVPDALNFMKKHNWNEISRHSDILARNTASAISNLTQIPLLSSAEFCAPQMVAIPLPDCDVDELKRRLYDEFNIEVPVFRWKDCCIVRISIQAYNTRADASRLIDALSDVLKLHA
jgi:isopenicillin-N epimerase|tara:strand:+ start:6719 stop:7891 length:1173 start_codon:yes stop_codon:yes gene_type:complete